MYFKKYGSITPVRMYDAGAALISSMISKANGGKAEPKDFLIYGKITDESGDEIVDADDFINRMAKMSNVKLAR